MSLPPEAIAGLLALGERFLSVLENAVNREADVRLAEVNKFEGGDYVALDSARQSAAVEATRIAAAAATETSKVFMAAVQADAERVRARRVAEEASREEREEREKRIAREREAFRRGNGRFQ